MLTTTDTAKLFDTILSIPGMNENVKIDLKLTRKEVLILHAVIRRGLSPKDEKDLGGFLETIPEDTLQRVSSVAEDCLSKAGLSELSEKLRALHGK